MGGGLLSGRARMGAADKAVRAVASRCSKKRECVCCWGGEVEGVSGYG